MLELEIRIQVYKTCILTNLAANLVTDSLLPVLLAKEITLPTYSEPCVNVKIKLDCHRPMKVISKQVLLTHAILTMNKYHRTLSKHTCSSFVSNETTNTNHLI